MNYEYAIRPYDRTPEGNIPSYSEIEANSDLLAFCDIFDMGMVDEPENDEELIEALVENGLLEKKCSANEALAILTEFQNNNIDASDEFVFYIKNLDTDKYVYENDYCDIDDWIESLEGDEGEFKEELEYELEDFCSDKIKKFFSSYIVDMKHEMWGTDGTFEDFWDDESAFESPLVNFLYGLAHYNEFSDGFENAEIYEQDDFEDLIDEAHRVDPKFNEKEWRTAFRIFMEDEE